jgi:hypothetical protein
VTTRIGTHQICDPEQFAKAWEALGDMTDEDCERADKAAHEEERENDRS